MVFAFFTSITLLPALISIFKPPGEETEVGYAGLRRSTAFWRATDTCFWC